MMQPEIRHRGVEARIREGKLFDVGDAKIERGVRGSRMTDHLGRKINAGCFRAARGGQRGDPARPARHIEKRHAGAGRDRVEQRIGERPRRA